MKQIILMRHAEAADADYDTNSPDMARRLTTRGALQAKATAIILSQEKILPNIIITSNTTRAQQTTQIVNSLLCNNQAKVVTQDWLYDDYTTQQLIDTIVQCATTSQPTEPATIMIIAHNPTLSYRAANLMRESQYIGFPTAGYIALQVEIDHWQELTARNAILLNSNFL